MAEHLWLHQKPYGIFAIFLVIKLFTLYLKKFYVDLSWSDLILKKSLNTSLTIIQIGDYMSDKDTSGYAIPAGLFIGLGLGIITGEVAGFLLIGLGFGFLVMFLSQRK